MHLFLFDDYHVTKRVLFAKKKKKKKKKKTPKKKKKKNQTKQNKKNTTQFGTNGLSLVERKGVLIRSKGAAVRMGYKKYQPTLCLTSIPRSHPKPSRALFLLE
jgi:hypothetical protein